MPASSSCSSCEAASSANQLCLPCSPASLTAALCFTCLFSFRQLPGRAWAALAGCRRCVATEQHGAAGARAPLSRSAIALHRSSHAHHLSPSAHAAAQLSPAAIHQLCARHPADCAHAAASRCDLAADSAHHGAAWHRVSSVKARHTPGKAQVESLFGSRAASSIRHLKSTFSIRQPVSELLIMSSSACCSCACARQNSGSGPDSSPTKGSIGAGGDCEPETGARADRDCLATGLPV